MLELPLFCETNDDEMLDIATHKEKPKYSAVYNIIPIRITYRPKTIAKSRHSQSRHGLETRRTSKCL